MAAQQLRLENDSRVGVIGGGPAGSFVSFFLLDMAIFTSHETFPNPAPAVAICAGESSQNLLCRYWQLRGSTFPQQWYSAGSTLTYSTRMSVK